MGRVRPVSGKQAPVRRSYRPAASGGAGKVRQQTIVTRVLLGCGVVGAVLFVVTFLVDGATRPGYRPSYHPVSALALGPRGWVQKSNFVVTGLLMIAAAVGTRGALQVVFGPVFLAAFGVSLAASGVFSMDAMRGYPPGTAPGTPSVLSRQHKLHAVFGFLVFSSLPVACVAFAVALQGIWVAHSLATAVVPVVLFITMAPLGSEMPHAPASSSGR